MFGPLVFLFVPLVATAGGPVYRCGPGDYADNCDRPAPAITVSRYTLEQWAERTRGEIPCPVHMRYLLYSGTWVCQVPQLRKVEPEKDERLLEGAGS